MCVARGTSIECLCIIDSHEHNSKKRSRARFFHLVAFAVKITSKRNQFSLGFESNGMPATSHMLEVPEQWEYNEVEFQFFLSLYIFLYLIKMITNGCLCTNRLSKFALPYLLALSSL